MAGKIKWKVTADVVKAFNSFRKEQMGQRYIAEDLINELATRFGFYKKERVLKNLVNTKTLQHENGFYWFTEVPITEPSLQAALKEVGKYYNSFKKRSDHSDKDEEAAVKLLLSTGKYTITRKRVVEDTLELKGDTISVVKTN